MAFLCATLLVGGVLLKKLKYFQVMLNIFEFWLVRETVDRAVGRSPKCIIKKPGKADSKNLRNINWYSCYKLFKTGKFHTFLVSFTILLSYPE